MNNPDVTEKLKTPAASTPASGSAATSKPQYDFYDEDEEYGMCYDPERDCPRCKGVGQCALLSGIEWDYVGPDYDTCPRCEGTGRL